MQSKKSQYLEMARACNQNARKFYNDSLALKNRRSLGHAHSLQILGVEEAIKAIIYRLAADGVVLLTSKSDNRSWALNEKDLLDHKVKHEILASIIATSIQYSPFYSAFDDVSEERIEKEEAKIIMARAIAQHQTLMFDLRDPNSQVSKRINRFFTLLSTLNDEKNRGFYVDKRDSQILRPNTLKVSNYEYWREFLEELLRLSKDLIDSGINPSMLGPIRESRKAIARRVKAIQKRSKNDNMRSVGSRN